MEQDNTKTYLIYFAAIALLVCAIVVLFGRMEFHNELEREVMPHTLLGYMDGLYYDDIVVVTKDDWPLWTEKFDRQWEDCIDFDNTMLDGRIGIFADIIYYENRYEKRSWFSGKLIKRASEFYYKPEGNLYLEAVYAPYPEPQIGVDQIVPQNYNFMAFDGKRTMTEFR